MVGFVDAEGCFFVGIAKGTTKIGKVVQLKFSISQHYRDELLLISFINYFGCGQYQKRNIKYSSGEYIVTKFKDINEKIIPKIFFTCNKIYGFFIF